MRPQPLFVDFFFQSDQNIPFQCPISLPKGNLMSLNTFLTLFWYFIHFYAPKSHSEVMRSSKMAYFSPLGPYRQSAVKPPPISAENEHWLLFWGVFCDFFKSYGSKPITLIMFFVVLWKVVPPLRAIFDIMTQNRENRKKRVQKWVILSPF